MTAMTSGTARFSGGRRTRRRMASAWSLTTVSLSLRMEVGLGADRLDGLPLVLGARLGNPSGKRHAEVVGQRLGVRLVQRAQGVQAGGGFGVAAQAHPHLLHRRAQAVEARRRQPVRAARARATSPHVFPGGRRGRGRPARGAPWRRSTAPGAMPLPAPPRSAERNCPARRSARRASSGCRAASGSSRGSGRRRATPAARPTSAPTRSAAPPAPPVRRQRRGGAAVRCWWAAIRRARPAAPRSPRAAKTRRTAPERIRSPAPQSPAPCPTRRRSGRAPPGCAAPHRPAPA